MRTTRRRIGLVARMVAALLLVAIWLWRPDEAWAQWTTDTNTHVTTTTDKVGIGTTSPNSQFDLRKDASGDAGPVVTLSNGSGGANAGGAVDFANPALSVPQQARIRSLDDSNWSAHLAFYTKTPGAANNSLAERMRLTSAGYVGVGTGAPASIFTVNLSNADYTNAGGAGSHFVMTNPHATGQSVISSIINGATVAKWRTDYVGNVSWVAGGGYHAFYTGGDVTSGPAKVVIENDGRVGIGTTAPAAGYRLDVAGAAKVGGDLNVTGNIIGANIQAKYQDVAEWVPSVQKLEAGTVVVLDSGRTNHVLASATAYDTKVAGVVSAQPGVILGTGGEGKVMVATTGRVKVRVDASRGAIRVGDLLVTSGVEGAAMKSVPVDLGGTPIHRPGTIIGKALEPLEKGVGEILVLLSLQ